MSSHDAYDVCIVGAGPAGASCAYYLAKAGRRVLLLERSAFPRDKICGDAICGNALGHLRRMGVLQKIMENDEAHPAAIGGMVSPRGISYIGNSADELGASPMVAIKRIFLDARIAQAACDAGAVLRERRNVSEASFDAPSRQWTIRCDGSVDDYRARTLVAADGSTSQLARRLGYIDRPPEAICSRAYIRADTTDFVHDGVLFYPPEVLPGYYVLLREARDELNYCTYIIPGGSAGIKDLRRLHDRGLHNNPHVSKAIGRHAVIQDMKGAPLRLGGIARSYGEHFLIIGDAAGLIDPLTGEGIQYAMDSAEIAAQTIDAALAADNLTSSQLKTYHDRWTAAFGRDFAWSSRLARFYARHPSFIDASAATLRRRGTPFLAEWAEIMTGIRPKSDFLRPAIWLPIVRDMVALRLGLAA